MDIEKIKKDWHDGKTHGEIQRIHRISRAVEFAITSCSDGLTVSEIERRVSKLSDEMKASEIRAAMSAA